MFSYDRAFSRNLGWTTEWEQAALRAKRVAIAGLGGVGGSHLLTLTRLGIGRFSLADMDTFGIENFNRQAGANLATIGRPKLDVMCEMALAINPDLLIRRLPAGVSLDGVDAFLDGCDLFVDALDFFALDIRAAVFARAAAQGIPAVTAAPIGMGVGFLAFLPGQQTFESYFRLRGQPPEEQALRFLMGVAPRGLHRAYLVDDTRVDLQAKRGPSTAAACELCAGMVGTQAIKLLLNRGDVPFAPTHLTFDAYRCRLVRTRLRWGAAGPLARLKRAIARPIYQRMAARTGPAVQGLEAPTTLDLVLDAARWAPSGDNTQPWRLTRTGTMAFQIHLRREPANPYEYRNGEPVLLSGGMLLESLAIAASAHAATLRWSLADPAGWTIDAELLDHAGAVPDPLVASLPMRSVVRGAMGRRALTAAEKRSLADALGPDLVITWHETLRERRVLAALGRRATNIRLRAPETFEVHRRVIDWARQRSPDGIPAQAVGLDRMTLTAMRWAMRQWPRMHRLNQVLGTRAASAQLDLWPALRCAAMFSIRPDSTGSAAGPAAQLRAGMALQRFWLTATRLGLGLQPALATLIFADLGCAGARFTAEPTLLQEAASLGSAFTDVLGPPSSVIFLGRLGRLRPGLPRARSTRRSVNELSETGLVPLPDQADLATAAISVDHMPPLPVT